MRVPPLPQRWTLQCSPKPVQLVRDSRDSIMGAAVGAHMGSLLGHSLTVADMMSDWSRPSTYCPVGVCLCIRDAQRHTWDQCTEHKTSDQNQWQAQPNHCEASCAVSKQTMRPAQESCDGDCCYAKGAGCCSSHNDDAWTKLSKACIQGADSSCCHNRQQASSHQADIRCQVSPAAAAMMQTCSLTASGSGLQWSVIDLFLDNHLNHSECPATGSSLCNTEQRQGDCKSSGEIQPSSAVDGASRNQQIQGGLSEVLLDDEWKALEEAQVVWDLAEQLQQSEQWLSLGLSAVPGNSASRSSWKHRSDCLQIQIPSLSNCVPVCIACCPPYTPAKSRASPASRHLQTYCAAICPAH